MSPYSENDDHSLRAIDSGPPALKPTTGVPQHNDSAVTMENVSRLDNIKVTSASEYN